MQKSNIDMNNTNLLTPTKTFMLPSSTILPSPNMLPSPPNIVSSASEKYMKKIEYKSTMPTTTSDGPIITDKIENNQFLNPITDSEKGILKFINLTFIHRFIKLGNNIKKSIGFL